MGDPSNAPQHEAPIRMRVRTGAGVVVPTTLISGDHRRVIADCPRTEEGKLPVGEMVTLRLSGSELVEPMTVGAIVRHRRDEASLTSYEFLFNDKPATIEYLVFAIDRFFNRRLSFRVRPEAGTRITARVEPEAGGSPVLARVLDVSATGCSIRLSPEMERLYATEDALQLTLPLPETGKTVVVCGAIRYRVLDEGQVRYGIEYVPRSTRQFRQTQKMILGYVMKQQRALIRARHQTGKS